MPPKAKFTREEVVQAALAIVKTEGSKSLTARTLGKALGSSACPIFTLFSGMDEVQKEVLAAANRLYERYLAEDMQAGKYPPYKGSGMGYIRFAKEEKMLFQLLFMRDRTGEEIPDGKEELRPLLRLLQENLGINEENAYRFHLEMWVYVHGIATMLATSYLEWDMAFVSVALSDMYGGLKLRYARLLEEKGI